MILTIFIGRRTSTESMLTWTMPSLPVLRSVYLDDCWEVGQPETRVNPSCLQLIGIQLRLGGATLSDTINEQVSHVVVHSRYVSWFTSWRQSSILPHLSSSLSPVLAGWIISILLPHPHIPLSLYGVSACNFLFELKCLIFFQWDDPCRYPQAHQQVACKEVPHCLGGLGLGFHESGQDAWWANVRAYRVIPAAPSIENISACYCYRFHCWFVVILEERRRQ